LHSNLASVKLDDAALSIVKATYAFVALQGEDANKTIAMQIKKQRRKTGDGINNARVAPEPAHGAGAKRVRQWWVYDSRTATKKRVLLLPISTAETGASAPVGSKAPRAPRQLATMATMAPVRR
jgi:hypothetical protein